MMKISFLLVCLLTLAITTCCSNESVLANNDHNNRSSKQVKVGFVADLADQWGAMAHEFSKMAISDFYKKHPKYETRLVLRARDSHSNVITSAARGEMREAKSGTSVNAYKPMSSISAYDVPDITLPAMQELEYISNTFQNMVTDLILKEKVVAIIGPETSQEAQFDISLGERYNIPIISYSASSPALSSPFFIQATQNDSSQVEAISSIIQEFGWGEVTPVYVNEFGGGMIPFLVDKLQQNMVRIPYRSAIPSNATENQIKDELTKLKERQTRVFIVHMDENLASRVFLEAHRSRMMSSEYVWIVTTRISNAFGTFSREVVQSMQGVLGVKTYLPKASYEAVKTLKTRWGKINASVDSSNPQTSMYGLWAYDTTFLLAEAVEQARPDSNESGSRLIEKLVNGRVEGGLSGEFRLVNGKLQTDTFEIINVVGSGEKEVGFWRSNNKGLIRDVDGSNNSSSLGKIIWPGDSIKVPKGWVTAKEKPLKILVPIKPGFTEFVQARLHNSNPIGFCIEVFEAVRKKLDYDLPVEYHPSPDSYNDLIRKVYTKDYDAVVGDVTIIANRSLYVDFALPYMESDVLMVVRAVKDSKGSSTALAFLKPLSWRLWVTTLCFFILIAVVVWVNEHDINDEFRQNSWRGQIGLYLFYSCSTMVFSNKEVPKSNMVRLVMVLWVFTLLLITNSYTANLASLLTVEKLEPAYTDVKELVRSGKNVGYQNGTFVSEYIQRMGFDRSQMKAYDSADKLHQLFSDGTEGGGIDAAFDEAPYVNLFLSQHCSEYTTLVPPVSRTDGFAFAFPRGSPLVADISRAVLNITEGELMSNLSNKWLNSSSDCPTGSWETRSESTLDLDSFVALFGITGGLCVASLLWKLGSFAYRRHKRRSLDGSVDGGRESFRKRLLSKLSRKFCGNNKGGRRVSKSASVSPVPETTAMVETSAPSSPGQAASLATITQA